MWRDCVQMSWGRRAAEVSAVATSAPKRADELGPSRSLEEQTAGVPGRAMRNEVSFWKDKGRERDKFQN